MAQISGAKRLSSTLLGVLVERGTNDLFFFLHINRLLSYDCSQNNEIKIHRYGRAINSLALFFSKCGINARLLFVSGEE